MCLTFPLKKKMSLSLFEGSQQLFYHFLLCCSTSQGWKKQSFVTSKLARSFLRPPALPMGQMVSVLLYIPIYPDLYVFTDEYRLLFKLPSKCIIIMLKFDNLNMVNTLGYPRFGTTSLCSKCSGYVLTLMPFRYEQNGHQPLGEAVCNQ